MGVDTHIQGNAAVVTLDWPDIANALGPSQAEQLGDAIFAAGASDGIAAVVITGRGVFCSGGDLRTLSELAASSSQAEVAEMVAGIYQRLIRALAGCPVPTIAAVDGPAVGLGADLVLACDMRFIGARGWLRQGWAAAGLIPGTGGVALLHAADPLLLWKAIAEQPKLDAEQCERLRIAEHGGERAIDAALARADQLGALPPATLRHYVELARPLRWPSDEHFAACASIQSGLIKSDRFAAFAERVLKDRT